MVYRSNREVGRVPTAPPARDRERGGCGGCLIIFLVLLLIAGIVVGGGYFYVTREIGEGRGSDETIEVAVDEGSSVKAVAAQLKEAGVIGSVNVFRVYCIYNNKGSGFMYGTHAFTTNMGYEEIIETLEQPSLEDQRPTITMTFPEGYTALRMALELEAQGFCTMQEFIDCCNNDQFDVPFFNRITVSDDKFIKLEGFLFPDTYEFYADASVHDIVETMLENFNDKVLTDEIEAKIAASGRSLEENVIMASIVQKESLGQDVYPMVASVFINRLNNSSEFPYLESDTSRESFEGNFIYGVLGYYYNGDTQPYLRNIPENVWRGYDTYSHKGIIVGAICSPGLDAILATLEPADTSYYFFITDEADNFYWGETDYDHSVNIEKVNQFNATYEG